MIGKFSECFAKVDDKEQKLPQEILEVLNAALPSNFMYVQDGSGHYRAVPNPNEICNGIRLTTQFDFEEGNNSEEFSKLKIIPRDKWDEYLYRTQKSLPVKNVQIGNDDKLVPLESLSKNPLTDSESVLSDAKMFPSGFAEPIKMLFESPEGDTAEIRFQQQAFDNIVEIKYESIDFPALAITMYQYDPLVEKCDEKAHTSEHNQLVVTYSITPAKAESVRDAVTALHIFRGLFNGKTKVNSHAIMSASKDDGIEPKRIEEALEFWETALRIEDKLCVKFIPSAEFVSEDVRFFAALKTCFFEGKSVVWKHPFDHFHVGGIKKSDKNVPFESCIGMESLRYVFVEGPIPATLLGAAFDIYSRSEMKDFIITNIKWDDESREKAEVYISDAPDKQWTLNRLYITEQDAMNHSNDTIVD